MSVSRTFQERRGLRTLWLFGAAAFSVASVASVSCTQGDASKVASSLGAGRAVDPSKFELAGAPDEGSTSTLESITLRVRGVGFAEYGYKVSAGTAPCDAKEIKDWASKGQSSEVALGSDGPKTLCVAFLDEEGASLGAPLVRTWTKKVASVEAALEPAPAKTTSQSRLPFAVKGEGIAEYAYALLAGTGSCADGNYVDWSSVAKPLVVNQDASGERLLCVKGRTELGREQAKATAYKWTFTLKEPHAVLVDPPARYNQLRAVRMEVAGEGVVKYKAVVREGRSGCDGADFDSSSWRKVSEPLLVEVRSDGKRTVCVRGQDAQGNVQSEPTEYEWLTAESVLPVATLVGVPSSVTRSSQLRVAVGGDTVTSYRLALVGPLATAPDCDTVAFDGAWKPVGDASNFALTTDGAYAVCALGRDATGAIQQEATRATFVRRSTAPVASLGGLPAFVSSTTTLQVFVSAAGGTEYAYSVLSASTDCAAAVLSAWSDLTRPLLAPIGGDGSKRLCVVARDETGNVQATPTVFDWLKDSLAPTLTLVGAPQGFSKVSALDVTVSGDAEEYVHAVVPASFACATLSLSSGWRPLTTHITDALFADGDYRLCVRGRDAAGNTSVALDVPWTKKTTAPTAALATAMPGAVAATDFTLQVSSTDTAFYKATFLNAPATTCAAAMFPATWTAVTTPVTIASSGSGLKRLCLLARDAAGNDQTSPTTIEWYLDVTPPTIGSFTLRDTVSGNTTTTNSLSARAVFDAPDGAQFCVSNSSAVPAVSSPCWVASANQAVTLTAGSNTRYGFARDQAGNTAGPVSATILYIDAAEFAGVQSVTPAGGGHLVVTWNAIPSHPANYDRYFVYLTSNQGVYDFTAPTGVVMGGGVTSRAFGGLPDGVSHCAVVRAGNSSGLIESNARELCATARAAVSVPVGGPTWSWLTGPFATYFSHALEGIAPGEIATVVGPAKAGYVGEGAFNLALTSSLAVSVSQIVRDHARGLIYASDWERSVVYRITESTGTVEVYAGQLDVRDSCTVGAASTAICFRYVAAIALDAAGNLYVGDYENHRVIRIDRASRVTSRVAGSGWDDKNGDGGPALNADVGRPDALAVDSQGRVLVAHKNRVRRFTVGGNIETVAGGDNGAEQNDSPAIGGRLGYATSIKMISDDEFYVSNRDWCELVKKVTISSDQMTTVAGKCGVNDDNYRAGRAANDTYLSGLRQIDIDLQGRLVFACTGYRAICRVRTDGKLELVNRVVSAGSDMRTNSSPNLPEEGQPLVDRRLWSFEGFAVLPNGAFLVGMSEMYRGVIARIDPDLTYHRVFGQHAFSRDMKKPANMRANEFVFTGKPIRLAFNAGGKLVVGTRPGGDGDQYGTSGNGYALFTYEGASRNLVPMETSLNTNEWLDAMTFAPDGALYFAAYRQIYRVDSFGSAVRVAGTGNSPDWNDYAGTGGDGGSALNARWYQMQGLVVDAAGNIYFTDVDYHIVRRVRASDGIIETVAGTPRESNGTGGALGDGGLATSAILRSPYGLALGSGGWIYVSERDGCRVRRFQPGGNIETVAGSLMGTCGFGGDGIAPTNTTLKNPRGLAVDSQGRILVADSGNNRIRRIDMAANTITTVAGGFGSMDLRSTGDGGPATSARLYAPDEVAADAFGNIYISTDGRVRMVRVSDRSALDP